jgi:mono/diheme cytochrome c family protein
MRLVPGAALIALALAGCAAAYAYLSAPGQRSPPALETLDTSTERGRYLALAGNCATCHTANGGEPYAGGLPLHTPFGVLHSTNITPNEDTGIGSWSFEEFHASMTHGVRPDGSHLYPAFPYPDFASMTDEDLGSLYLFLQSLVPVRRETPSNALAFPFDQRPLLALWKRLYLDTQPFQPDAQQSAQWNRGAYLVEGVGHCGACHSPRNLLGAEQASLALTGGTYLDTVRFGYHRAWAAVNLTPHAMGMAARSESEIVDYLARGLSDHAVVHGPMRDVVMNSTRHLREEDLQAIALYLKSLPAIAQPPGPPPSGETLAAGEVVYTVHCGSCHLPTGEGDEGLGVPLVDSPLVRAPGAASLINVILYGPHLPEKLVVNRSGMKMFGKRLSDADIASVASFVRTEFGNGAGGVTKEEVHAQR